MRIIRIIGVVSLVLAAVFIFVLSPTSGPGAGPLTYWYTGLVLVALGAASFIVFGVLHELRRNRTRM